VLANKNVSARERVRKAGNKRNKQSAFLWIKVWVNYVLSSIVKDRGSIPNDIGDRVLITNNLYATRYYLTSIIHVKSLGLKTPVTLGSEINNYLREEGCSAVVDFVLKNSTFDINPNDHGLKSRARMWEAALKAPGITKREKEVAARCLYTKEIAEGGEQLYSTRMFLYIRAKTGTELTAAEKLVYKFLRSIEAGYSQVTGNVKEVLMYTLLLSNKPPQNIKDFPAIITSSQVLSQMMPNSGSFNGTDGDYLGVNILNYSQFLLNWRSITKARNVYVVAPAGVGKTVLALNACCSARENGMAVCVQDIKGNEFTYFIQSTGGFIVSLRQTSSGFINSWRMIKEDTTEERAESYFKGRVNFSKEQIVILSGLTLSEERLELEELLEEFHESLYISLGVVPENRNSWRNTNELNPYVIYEMLVEYMSPAIQKKYARITKTVLNALRITMSRNGSKSYLFAEEFDYAAILKAPTLMFDFGILEGATDDKDAVIFKLKFAYMRKLNAEYVAYKYSKGIKVFQVLEESQIAVNDPDIIRGYVEAFTLRRAQGQTTWLLGNSVSALVNSSLSSSLIENTTALFIGELSKSAKEIVISKFGLEKFKDLMDRLGFDEEYINSFLFINKMERRPVVAIVKVELDKDTKYKLLTPVKQNIGSIN